MAEPGWQASEWIGAVCLGMAYLIWPKNTSGPPRRCWKDMSACCHCNQTPDKHMKNSLPLYSLTTINMKNSDNQTQMTNNKSLSVLPVHTRGLAGAGLGAHKHNFLWLDVVFFFVNSPTMSLRVTVKGNTSSC